MTTTSVPKATADRIKRGRALAGDVEPRGHGRYGVPSCTADEVYTVDLDVFGSGDGESCTCPDRAPVCKHIVAATVYRAKYKARARTRRRSDLERVRYEMMDEDERLELAELAGVAI